MRTFWQRFRFFGNKLYLMTLFAFAFFPLHKSFSSLRLNAREFFRSTPSVIYLVANFLSLGRKTSGVNKSIKFLEKQQNLITSRFGVLSNPKVTKGQKHEPNLL
jgi:hypothetical protein